MNIAVILAGGVGSRVGADRPKQFIEVLGKPVLYYTIEVFQKHPLIDAIEVVCHKSWKDYLQKIIEDGGFDKVKWIADGGDTFQQSVLNGVFYLEDKVNEDDIILVHFGASPFLEEYIITDNIRVCKEKGNAISTTDFFVLSGIKDSTKSVDDKENYTHEYIDRETIACMSSPHAFRYGLIRNFYKEAIQTGVINEVEPHTTTLMQKMNIPIYFSKGSQTNIKITRREDLELFEGYLLERRKKNYLIESRRFDVVELEDKINNRVHSLVNSEKWSRLNMSLSLNEYEKELKSLISAFFDKNTAEKERARLYGRVMSEMDIQDWK